MTPLPQIDPPSRLSQTFLRHLDRCDRSAYLYLKHKGGAPSHEKNRGTVLHEFCERLMRTLIEQGERTLYAVAEGEDPAHAKREVASLTAAMVDEILRDRTDLTIPAAEADAVRQMAYHVAVGLDVDPETVLGIERKFVLDIGDWQVVGKLDLCAMLDPHTAEVSDYKTQFAIPAQGDFEDSFQQRLYGLLLLFGQPVEEFPVGAGRLVVSGDGTEMWDDGSHCVRLDEIRGIKGVDPCSGELVVKGDTLHAERRLDPIGEHFNFVRTRELYPRFLTEDGRLRERSMVLTRQDLSDFRFDLERLVDRASEALSSEGWGWPATAGSHCSQCPSPSECPIPAELRPESLDTPEEVGRALQWAEVESANVRAVKAAARRYAERHGPVRVGRDLIYEFEVTDSFDTNWDELEPAIHRAVNFGEPFDLSEYRVPKPSTRFKKRKLTAEEMEESEPVLTADEKWGAEAPF